MSTLKAAYINELYKISKKKKIVLATIFSIIAVLIGGAVVYSLNRYSGIRITGSSEFSLLILQVLSYTLIPLFTAFVCIDMFGVEFVEQTMKLTLTSPASRLTVFFAKILAIASFIMANLLFIMFLAVVTSFFINGTSYNLFKILVSYLLEFFPIFIFALAVVAISNFAKGPTIAFMFSVLLFIVFNGLGIVFPYLKSFLFTSAFDWYKLFLGSYVNLNKIIRVFAILSGYGIMLFGIGLYLFDKREL